MTFLSCGRYTVHIIYLFSFFLFTKKKATLNTRTAKDPKHSLPIKENISFGNSFGTLSIALHHRSGSVWGRQQHYIKSVDRLEMPAVLLRMCKMTCDWI